MMTKGDVKFTTFTEINLPNLQMFIKNNSRFCKGVFSYVLPVLSSLPDSFLEFSVS